MTDTLFGPVTFGGGARWNPLARESDPPEMRVQHSVMDVAIALRGASPNMNLGMTDGYIWAGEWDLALSEMAAIVQDNPGQSNDLADTMLARAQAIMSAAMQDSEGSK